MGFHEAISAGVAYFEAETPSAYTIDGRTESFIGVFNAHRDGRSLGLGGFAEDADGILVSSKAQFGATPPRNGLRLTVEGKRYVIDGIETDSHTFTLLLKGVNK